MKWREKSNRQPVRWVTESLPPFLPVAAASPGDASGHGADPVDSALLGVHRTRLFNLTNPRRDLRRRLLHTLNKVIPFKESRGRFPQAIAGLIFGFLGHEGIRKCSVDFDLALHSHVLYESGKVDPLHSRSGGLTKTSSTRLGS